MTKLFSRAYKGAYANQVLTMPVVGKVKFNHDGTLDVEDDKYESLVKATVDSFDFIVMDMIGESPATVTISGNSQLLQDDHQIRIEEIEQELKQLKFKDLVELANNAGVKIDKDVTDSGLRHLVAVEIEKRENEEPETDDSN